MATDGRERKEVIWLEDMGRNGTWSNQ